MVDQNLAHLFCYYCVCEILSCKFKFVTSSKCDYLLLLEERPIVQLGRDGRCNDIVWFGRPLY